MSTAASAAALELRLRDGGWVFNAPSSGEEAEIDRLLLFISAGLASVAGRPATEAAVPGASLHHRVLTTLTAAAALGREGGGSPLAAKCREYSDYLSEKCSEHFVPPPHQLGAGIDARSLGAEGRDVILTVVREILGHLANHIREEEAARIEAAPAPSPAEAGPPLRFAPSVDDSGKPRRYMYVGNETAIVEMHEGFSLFLDLRDLSLVPTLLQTGWWEPWIDQILRSLLAPGMSYVNAGANVGYHACLGAKLVGHAGRVWAFEANPLAFGLLRRSVFYNGFSTRSRLFQAAVAGASGRETLRFVREQLGGGQIYEPEAFGRDATGPEPGDAFVYGRAEFEAVEVSCVTLDETVGRKLGSLDVLHMDIEGAEGPALLGGADLVRRSPDLRMILEWSIGGRFDEGLRKAYREAAGLISSERFRLYRITPPAGNVFSTPPDLTRVDEQDLLALPHCDLFAVRS